MATVQSLARLNADQSEGCIYRLAAGLCAVALQ
jgi:hypothetical protein